MTAMNELSRAGAAPWVGRGSASVHKAISTLV